jgi:hypothetical protein
MDGSSAQRAFARPHSPSAWVTSGPEVQVFVDDSGRRALGVRLACLAAAALCAFWLTGLVVGMVGFSSFAPRGFANLAQRGVSPHASKDFVADVGERQGAPIGRRRAIAARATRLQAVSAQPACTSYRAGARASSGRRRIALRTACLVQLAAADQHRDVASA